MLTLSFFAVDNTSPKMEGRVQGATATSSLVVVNIIWWMVMIAAIGVGAAHINACPVQPFVPIYLSVLGAASIISLTLTYSQRMSESGIIYILISTCMSFLHIFTFCWIIAGSYWVYTVYPPNYTPGTRYCQKTTFQFAFVLTTLVWVIMALSFCCGGCYIVFACCCGTLSARHRLSPNHNTLYGATDGAQGGAAGDV
ncbi:transmembrane protein 272-like [Scomber japonicus]|uniref:transmembrane protein 272-like n=1 Tax=Scomber japonicus TaxID=13676 RepID=UPI0023052BA7|nr:transmembrane protein 272-like [Scomber japonicus]